VKSAAAVAEAKKTAAPAKSAKPPAAKEAPSIK
jgi:hypothetical protein